MSKVKDKPAVRPKHKSCLQRNELPLPKGMPVYNVDGHYRTQDGDDWIRCREEFHHQLADCRPSGKTRRVSLYYGTSKPEALARLVRYVEARLNLRYAQRTRVFICRKPPQDDEKKKQKFRVVFIEISPFWTSQRLRANFFTILLRASRNANWVKPWTNPLETLLQQDYLKETSLGTAMFLCGHTVQKKSDTYGWVDDLSEYNNSAHETLGKPKSTKEAKFFRSKKSLSLLTKAERSQLRKWAHANGVPTKELKFIGKE